MAESDARVAELQTKFDEMKAFASMHIHNFKSQAKALSDELAAGRARSAEAIRLTNVR